MKKIRKNRFGTWFFELLEPAEKPLAKEVDEIFSRTPEQALRRDMEMIGMDFYTAMDKLSTDVTKAQIPSAKSAAKADAW